MQYLNPINLIKSLLLFVWFQLYNNVQKEYIYIYMNTDSMNIIKQNNGIITV